MSKYLRATPFETDFDGDRVTCRLKPIRRGDALRIVAAQKEATKALSEGTEEKVQRAEINMALLPLFAEIVPGYVDEFKGLRTADGSEVEMPEVTANLYFTPLLIALGWSLIAAGRVPDPKAPASLPAATSAA